MLAYCLINLIKGYYYNSNKGKNTKAMKRLKSMYTENHKRERFLLMEDRALSLEDCRYEQSSNFSKKTNLKGIDDINDSSSQLNLRYLI